MASPALDIARSRAAGCAPARCPGADPKAPPRSRWSDTDALPNGTRRSRARSTPRRKPPPPVRRVRRRWGSRRWRRRSAPRRRSGAGHPRAAPAPDHFPPTGVPTARTPRSHRVRDRRPPLPGRALALHGHPGQRLGPGERSMLSCGRPTPAARSGRTCRGPRAAANAAGLPASAGTNTSASTGPSVGGLVNPGASDTPLPDHRVVGGQGLPGRPRFPETVRPAGNGDERATTRTPGVRRIGRSLSASPPCRIARRRVARTRSSTAPHSTAQVGPEPKRLRLRATRSYAAWPTRSKTGRKNPIVPTITMLRAHAGPPCKLRRTPSTRK